MDKVACMNKISRYFLTELWKISLNTAYKAGWVTGFFRGTYGLYPREETETEREARELYIKQLDRLKEIFKK
jgi:hypothetical protein